jgi:hypothetical protein
MDEQRTKKFVGIKTDMPEELLDVDRRFDLYLKSQEAQIAIKKAGLHIPPRPDVEWNDPEDITALDEHDMERLSWLIARWIGYAEGVVSVADIDQAGAEGALEFITNAVMLLQETKSVTEAKALASIDKRVDDARQRYYNAYAHFKMAQANLKEFIRKAEALSRTLSWRQHKLDKFKSGAPF